MWGKSKSLVNAFCKKVPARVSMIDTVQDVLVVVMRMLTFRRVEIRLNLGTLIIGM